MSRFSYALLSAFIFSSSIDILRSSKVHLVAHFFSFPWFFFSANANLTSKCFAIIASFAFIIEAIWSFNEEALADLLHWSFSIFLPSGLFLFLPPSSSTSSSSMLVRAHCVLHLGVVAGPLSRHWCLAFLEDIFPNFLNVFVIVYTLSSSSSYTSNSSSGPLMRSTEFSSNI